MGSIFHLAIIEELDTEKPSFRPSKWPWKLKLLKIVNCQNCQKIVLSQLDKVGGHRDPLGSITHVDMVLEFLEEKQLYAKPSKCAFGCH